MITRHTSTPIALRLALRELRGGLNGFKIFMACLILGVTAIAAIASLTRAIEDGMEREGQSILGGDVEISLFQKEADETFMAWAADKGDLSQSARFRTMAHITNTGDSTLVELRAVDDLYPLYGTFDTTPVKDSTSLFEKRGDVWGTVVDPAIADRYGLQLGDTLKFGAVTAEIRAFIENEPDKANLGFQLGPSAFIKHTALDETGLVTVGSLINHIYRLRVPSGTDIQALEDNLKETFPDAAWRVRNKTNAAGGLRRFIDQMGMFLTLVGISALVVGGVGVGNAVRGYMDRKTRTIATLKILGAKGDTVFAVYFIQILAIALVAILIGLTVGALLPDFLATFLPDNLPIKPEGGIYPTALILATLYGLLITAAFTLWPLGKARDLPAVHLFRAVVAPSTAWPRKIYVAAIAGAIIVVAMLAVGLASNKILAAGFMGGSMVVLGLLRLTSWFIERGAAKLPRPKKPLLRMAVANLHRPGAATGAVVISLGLGLTLFASLALIQGNMDKQLQDQVPSEAPAFFILDIQPTDVAAFETTASSVSGVSDIMTIPNLRGRITQLNGVSSDEIEADKKAHWILRGDRGLTYMENLNAGSTVVDGEWWPADYTGGPEISFAKEEADELGLTIGDTLTISVLGREITATIRSLREINWGSFGFNFVIMFDPYTLKAAPHTYMATLKAEGDAEKQAHRILTQKFPGITAVRMKEVLTSMNAIVGQVGTAVRATALVAIIAGILVLAGAIAAGFRQRVYESVILKVVGAVRSQILKAYLIEYALIGLITATIALTLGSITGFVVVDQVMELDFTFLVGPMLATVATSLLVTVLFGLASSFRALSIKPNEVLRSE